MKNAWTSVVAMQVVQVATSEMESGDDAAHPRLCPPNPFSQWGLPSRKDQPLALGMPLTVLNGFNPAVCVPGLSNAQNPMLAMMRDPLFMQLMLLGLMLMAMQQPMSGKPRSGLGRPMNQPSFAPSFLPLFPPKLPSLPSPTFGGKVFNPWLESGPNSGLNAESDPSASTDSTGAGKPVKKPEARAEVEVEDDKKPVKKPEARAEVEVEDDKKPVKKPEARAEVEVEDDKKPVKKPEARAEVEVEDDKKPVKKPEARAEVEVEDDKKPVKKPEARAEVEVEDDKKPVKKPEARAEVEVEDDKKPVKKPEARAEVEVEDDKKPVKKPEARAEVEVEDDKKPVKKPEARAEVEVEDDKKPVKKPEVAAVAGKKKDGDDDDIEPSPGNTLPPLKGKAETPEAVVEVGPAKAKLKGYAKGYLDDGKAVGELGHDSQVTIGGDPNLTLRRKETLKGKTNFNRRDGIGSEVQAETTYSLGDPKDPSLTVGAKGVAGANFNTDKSHVEARAKVTVPVLGEVDVAGGGVELNTGKDGRYGINADVSVSKLVASPRAEVVVSPDGTTTAGLGADVGLGKIKGVPLTLGADVGVKRTAGGDVAVTGGVKVPIIGQFSGSVGTDGASIRGPLGEFQPKRIISRPPWRWFDKD